MKPNRMCLSRFALLTLLFCSVASWGQDPSPSTDPFSKRSQRLVLSAEGAKALDQPGDAEIPPLLFIPVGPEANSPRGLAFAALKQQIADRQKRNGRTEMSLVESYRDLEKALAVENDVEMALLDAQDERLKRMGFVCQPVDGECRRFIDWTAWIHDKAGNKSGYVKEEKLMTHQDSFLASGEFILVETYVREFKGASGGRETVSVEMPVHYYSYGQTKIKTERGEGDGEEVIDTYRFSAGELRVRKKRADWAY